MADMDSLPILDRAILMSMTGDDTDLAVEVVEIFQEQASLWARLLDPKAEPSQWADAAHSLKGSCLSIGALRLASACEKAEKAGRSATPPSLTAAAVLLGDIRDILGPTREAAAKTIYDLTTGRSRKAS